jgi:hypothetical protein
MGTVLVHAALSGTWQDALTALDEVTVYRPPQVRVAVYPDATDLCPPWERPHDAPGWSDLREESPEEGREWRGVVLLLKHHASLEEAHAALAHAWPKLQEKGYVAYLVAPGGLMRGQRDNFAQRMALYRAWWHWRQTAPSPSLYAFIEAIADARAEVADEKGRCVNDLAIVSGVWVKEVPDVDAIRKDVYSWLPPLMPSDTVPATLTAYVAAEAARGDRAACEYVALVGDVYPNQHTNSR